MDVQLQKIAKVWPGIQHVFSVPHNKTEYDELLRILDSLIDEVGENESHPLASLMETIGSLIESYESKMLPEMETDPIETLRWLMTEHELKQADLTDIGSQGVVSEILSGKRQLNIRQVKQLSKRFNVSPSVFL